MPIPSWSTETSPAARWSQPSVLATTFSWQRVGEDEGDARAGFPESTLAALASVPGVRASKHLITAPWSAYALVHAHCWHIPGATNTAGVCLPRPWASTSPEELRHRIENAPIRPWLLTGTPGWDREPRPFTLLAYQIEALWFALERGGGIWDQAAGAGKTVQALVWAALQPPGPVLVVTKRGPALQVTREVRRFLYTEALRLPPPSSMKMRQGERMKLDDTIDEYLLTRQAHGERPILVTTWDSLRAHGESLLAAVVKYGFSAVVWDECHLAKASKRTTWVSTLHGPQAAGHTGSRSAFAWQLAKAIPRRLAMSATIVFDRRSDLYGQFTLVEPHGWGRTGTAFGLRYCGGTPGRGGSLDVSGTSNTAELRERMAAIVHHVPKAVSHAGLPAVHMITRHIPTEDQAKTTGFRAIMRGWARRAGQGDAAGTMRLRELEIQEAAARKRPATLDVLAEELAQAGQGAARGKVIVFTGRHADCWGLHESIRAKWPELTVWCGLRPREGAEDTLVEAPEDGDDADDSASAFHLLDDAERQAVQDTYMAHPGPCVLVATGYSWGTGLDLQDTDALILNMLPYSPGDFDQWRGRVERHGMNRACNVYLLVAEGTADVRIAEILAEKAPDVEVLTGQQSLKGLVRSLRGMDRKDDILDRLLARLNAVDLDWEDAEGE